VLEPTDAPPEPRQRWRLVVARDASSTTQTQRELTEAWEAAILAADLPVAWSDAATPRPRISFGAPLPVGIAADGELIDVVLVERWPVWRVREALSAVVPAGWRIVDLQDVWLAGPPLAGRVAAADYRITLVPSGPGGPSGALDPDELARACTALLAATAIPRERVKGTATVRYDLRPLLIDVRVAEAGPPIVVGTRTRFHPELGTGRPEEVVAALAERLGAPLGIGSVVRARVVLADDLRGVGDAGSVAGPTD
jgi:radical SAM-linked protein